MAVRKPKFDPTKNYKWEPTDEFIIGGEDFSTLYNVIKRATFSGSGIAPIELVNMYQILQAIFVQGVEQNVIKEQNNEENIPDPTASYS